MLDTRNDIICPSCGNKYAAENMVVSLYKIKGHGNNMDYVLETCPHCNQDFYRLNIDPELYRARIRGVCLEYMTDLYVRKLNENHSPLPEMERLVREEVAAAYSVHISDFYILSEKVSKEDIIHETN